MAGTMKIVVAIEGVDGAGKSTLAGFIERLCAHHGKQCTRVGRRTGFVNSAVTKLTQLLSEEAMNLTPHAEVLLRVAREHQRAQMAAEAPSGVVLLDRFVLTPLAVARLHGVDAEPIVPILKDVASRAALHATLFVGCRFEVAWSRVIDRNLHSLLPYGRSETLLKQMSDFLEEEFHKGILTGQQWPVENSGPREAAHEQLAGYLMPYLKDLVPKAPTG
jgi:thymidylate kinase